MLSTSEVSSFGAAELRELPPTVAHRQVRARARHTHSLACTGYAAGWSAPEQHCVDRRDRLEVCKQARELRHTRQLGHSLQRVCRAAPLEKGGGLAPGGEAQNAQYAARRAIPAPARA